MRIATKGISGWSYLMSGRLMDYSHRWVAIDHYWLFYGWEVQLS